MLALACACGAPPGGPLRTWSDESSSSRVDPSRGASFPDVVAQIAREGVSQGIELRAIPITPSYLWAFHLRRANADLVERREARARLRHDLARFTTRHTSFVVTLRFAGGRPLSAGDPMLDLRAWRFHLRTGRNVVLEPVTISPYESARETDSERAGLLSSSDHIVFEHVVRGALRFRHQLHEDAGSVALEASPPSPTGATVRVRWRVAD